MTQNPRLTASLVSRWGDDPWALGSWSLIGRGGSPADRVALGVPVGDRLRIAGEATHPSRAGMTHGAYEQGVGAATWAAEAGHRRVAVVGAGMAGLGAARTLTGYGVRTEVWEARGRIGGRAYGVDLDGFTFDLGANWLQQYDGNALARIAEELSLPVIATDFGDPLVLGSPSAGAPGGLERELRARLERASPQDAIADVVEQWLRDPAPFTADEILRLVDAEIVMDSGAPLAWLSARHGFEPGVGEGDRWIVGSYRLLADHLAERLDVRLERPVRSVRIGEHEVTLVADGFEEAFDAVIVTVPLPVLKQGRIEFEPPLPPPHRTALERLGAGRVEKVVLRFDHRFWPVHPAGYYRVHGPEATCVSEWLDATEADGVPTIVGLFAGPWLDRIWSGSDDDVAARAAEIFQRASRRGSTTGVV
ncbi:FAD-dependent oxidoreductase [Actinoplanes sp. NPDC048796]|uniref:NAD(P)/FAD-dependent oxidoreductase n=1 Tax=Actinoplanes sp. NPDC048796 TaxID=3155640 RepID=UPI0034013219